MLKCYHAGMPIRTQLTIERQSMSTFQISIVVYGEGTDPHNRSHWSIIFHEPDAERGDVLQVFPVDQHRLWYQFDRRDDTVILDSTAEGYFQVATIFALQRAQAMEIVSKEPAPRNGRDRCQDWVLSCVIAMEAEDLVPGGTSQLVSDLVGRPAVEVATALGSRWKPSNRH